jgi:ABC-type sugar transport system permease subunit
MSSSGAAANSLQPPLSLEDRLYRLWRGVRLHKFCYYFVLPTFLLLIVFSYYPPLRAIYQSFTIWDGSVVSIWVGLDNFKELFLQDPFLWASMRNMGILLVANIVKTVVPPFLCAELIHNLRHARGRYCFRLVFVVPMVVPGIVGILLWQFIYGGETGTLNQFLKLVGEIDGLHFVAGWARPWLGNAKYALGALIFMGAPWISGIGMLIFLAGLQNIPESIYEAARIEGISPWKRMLYIDVPLVLGQIKLLTTLAIIGTIRGYEAVLVMTQGGPGFSTYVPGYHMYKQAFNYDRYGYACAVGMILFVLILFFVYINNKFLKSDVEY